MEKSKTKLFSGNKRTPWEIIIIIILLLLWFYIPDKSEDVDDYSICVDHCVQDIEDCLWMSKIYNRNGNAYISDSESESCTMDLDLCVSSCKSRYLD